MKDERERTTARSHRGALRAPVTQPSNRCLSVCLLTPKTSLPIEAEATEEPCHSEEGYARRGNPFSKCFEYMGI